MECHKKWLEIINMDVKSELKNYDGLFNRKPYYLADVKSNIKNFVNVLSVLLKQKPIDNYIGEEKIKEHMEELLKLMKLDTFTIDITGETMIIKINNITINVEPGHSSITKKR